ncbi:hypothetical protein OGAPHI_004672 [Ogataea philodendri]|uniref:Uncharacterized protein n=1 Tax=Ogataea philodendri TaxID=1378263 RepID=A0A9P8P1S4_9ASCO|nr:uncharacterized protein OGAPHI_004672 [Ogataea philodendri]KAH3663958.1 hypothetical protein OGAPHI_004672 [Ogataea philodendri]
MTVYFIAGASRGIGLEVVRQLSSTQSNHVIASYRSKNTAQDLFELSKQKNVDLVDLDVDDEKSVDLLSSKLEKLTSVIDVAVLNAGIGKNYASVIDTPRDAWIQHFVTNTLGPIAVFKQIRELVLKSTIRKVYFTSSAAGSIQNYISFPIAAYGTSKAALNFAVKELTDEIPEITFVMFHPGLVPTELVMNPLDAMMEDEDAKKAFLALSLTPAQSATYIIAAINSNIKSGRFIRVDDQTDIPF